MQPFEEPVTEPAEPPTTRPSAPDVRREAVGATPRGRHVRHDPSPTLEWPTAREPELAREPEPTPEPGPAREPELAPEPELARDHGRPEPELIASASLEEPAYTALPSVPTEPTVPAVPTGRQVAPNLLSRVLVIGLVLAALLVAGGVAFVWGDDAQRGAQRETAPNAAAARRDPTIGRRVAVTELLKQRGAAVRHKDKAAFLALIDPTAEAFRAQQSELFDRLAKLPFDGWSYQLAGDGPGLPPDRALQLPLGTSIARVRLHYQFAGSDSQVEREQYLTVVPRGGRWLLAGNDDATAAGLQTERDIWDLGPVRVVHGSSSLVLGDAPNGDLRRLAAEADRGVKDVSGVWKAQWSRHPVLVVPKSQQDMATLIGSDGKGLSQIAAVTTGSFESGLSRGDRIVVNPAAWHTLGALGRRVVMTHEMTHLATRAVTVSPVPIWLSEGFADYVAYQALKVPTNVIAGDVFDDVRKGNGPRALPDNQDFDAARGDIASAYGGAWLACRMIADRFGQPKLIKLYLALADSRSPPPGGDVKATLGITDDMLVKQWRGYLASRSKG